MMTPDHYATLQVLPGASIAVIRASYKALIQQYHPDRHLPREDAEELTKRLNEAYRVLSDPELRAAYDELRGQSQNKGTPNEDAERPAPPQEKPRSRTHRSQNSDNRPRHENPPARVSWWWTPSVLMAGLAVRHITEQWVTANTMICGLAFIAAAATVYIIAKRLAGSDPKKATPVLVGIGILIGSWCAIAISNEAFISRYAPGSAATQTQPAGTLSWDAEVQAWSEQNQDFLATPGAKELLQAEINSTSAEYSHNISDRDLIQLAGLRARQKMKAAAAERAPLILPSYLKLTPVDHDPFTAPPEKKKGPEPFVKRGWFGRCPTAYVDHPADPKKCALPHVAERMLERARASSRSR